MFYDNKLQFFYWEARSGCKVRATPPLPDFLFQKSLFLKKTKKLSAKRENQSDEMLRNPFARSDQTRRINSQRPLLRYVNRVARTLHVRRLATGSTDGEWDLLERLAFLCTTSLCVSTAFNVCVYVVKKKKITRRQHPVQSDLHLVILFTEVKRRRTCDFESSVNRRRSKCV